MKKIAIFLLAFSLFTAGCHKQEPVETVNIKNDDNKAMEIKNKTEKEEKNGNIIETIESSTKTENLNQTTEIVKAESQARYIAYNQENLTEAKGKKRILFFHASWCPGCIAVNKDINQKIESIPTDVRILKVDYDKESELKKKYGVTYQHTFVQINDKGEKIQLFTGTPNLEEIIDKL